MSGHNAASVLLKVCLFAAVLAVPSVSAAGYKETYTVYIDTSYKSAGGFLGSARNSTDSTQYIGCNLDSSTSSVTGFCFAEDSAGTWETCMTSSAPMITAIAALKSDGYLYFRWDSYGNCIRVYTETGSHEEPKK